MTEAIRAKLVGKLRAPDYPDFSILDTVDGFSKEEARLARYDRE